jgi:hypothetical protein
MRAPVLVALLVSTSAHAQVGFYKSSEPPGFSRRWTEMCIQAGSEQTLNVTLFGGYCPTAGNDCANMRFDELTFEAKPNEGGVLLYSNQGCKLQVNIGKSGARVTQRGRCGEYNIFAGHYTRRAVEVGKDDCSPRARSETHRECLNFCVRGARRLVHGGGRRLRRTDRRGGQVGLHITRRPS